MTNFYGWQPSLLSRDLTSGSEWGAANIRMNQAWADMQARSTLYMTPTMNCGAFIDYGSPCGGMNFLLDPRYTIQQWQWNNNNGGGFNPWGNMGMNWNNPWSNWGWNGGNTQGSSSSASTPTERAFQKKYNKLLSLVKQLASDDSPLLPDRKDVLDEIIKHPVGKTYEEKFNNLKAEYDQISKQDIKDFLASSASSRFGIDGTEKKDNEKAFYLKLQNVGYEFTDSAVDDQIYDLYRTISSITDKNEGKYQQESSILSNLASPSSLYDILDVVSSWNTQKQDSTGKEKRIIDLIKDKYDALPAGTEGDTARDSIKTQVISPVVNSLINRARGLKSKLDSASQTKMQNAMTKLENAYNATNAKVDSGLSRAFDELYVLARKAAVAQLRAEINATFGSVDPDLFNDTLFEDDTTKDLKAEGFTETDISAANVAVVASSDSGSYTPRVDETKPARDQLAEITGTDKALSKAVSVTGISGVSEAWIDNNTGKVYILKKNSDDEEEIHELKGVKVESGKVSPDPSATISTEKVSANSIQIASAQAKKDKEALDKEKEAVTNLLTKTDIITEQSTTATIDGTPCKVYKETKGAQREFVLVDGILYEYKDGGKGDKVTAESIEAAYNSAVSAAKAAVSDLTSSGRRVASLLGRWTDADDDEEIGLELAKIDKDNVLSFLKGYYETAGKGGEGLIEKLDDDTWDDNVPISLEKKIIKAVLDKAQEKGLENDISYKRLTTYYNEFENGKYKDCTSFNKVKDFWSSTWLFGALWGGWTNYNEAIDKELEKLFDKMNS